MKKSEMINSWIKATGLSSEQAEGYLEHLAVIMAKELEVGGKVPLPGIGKLKAVIKPERHGRNPRTGKNILIKARKTVKFLPSKTMKECLAK